MLSFARRPAPWTLQRTRWLCSSSVRTQQTSTQSQQGHNDAVIRNQVGVQLLTPYLRSRIFPSSQQQQHPPIDSEALTISQAHLLSHSLNPLSPSSPPLPPPVFSLPQLRGQNVDEHFHNISLYQSAHYRSLALSLAAQNSNTRVYGKGETKGEVEAPERWNVQSGWTKYHPDGSFEPVDYPEEEVLVFDVETLWKESDFPILATALSKTNWYAWISPWILGESQSAAHLIPLPTVSHAKSGSDDKKGIEKRLIVGHNVGFDRARIKEEYDIEGTGNRFLDTMSLHIACFGLTSTQKMEQLSINRRLKETPPSSIALLEQDALSISSNDEESEKKSLGYGYTDTTTLNSLSEVARQHCGIHLDKSFRTAFSVFSPSQVREQIQDLLSYCAKDTHATFQIFQVLLPKFLASCPHPTSFAGILKMGSSFLPLDKSWIDYVQSSENTFERMAGSVRDKLDYLAEEAKSLMHVRSPSASTSSSSSDVVSDGGEGGYVWEADPWLKQLDWSPKKARRLKKVGKEKELLPFAYGLKNWLERLEKLKKKVVKSKYLLALLDLKWQGKEVWIDDKWGPCVPLRAGEVVEGIRSEDRVPWEEWDDEVSKSLLGAELQMYRLPSSPSSSSSSKADEDLTSLLTRDQWLTLLESSVHPAQTDIIRKWIVGEKPKRGEAAELFSILREKGEEAMQKLAEAAEKGEKLGRLEQLRGEKEAERPSKVEEDKAEAERARQVPEDLIWPKWYWDLDRAKPSSSSASKGSEESGEGGGGAQGLNLTVRSKVAPILLKLSWNGYPLYRTKRHGWMYRIPREEFDPHSGLVQVDFGESSRMGGEEGAEEQDGADAKDDTLPLRMDEEGIYVRMPHSQGNDLNVGSPLAKSFIADFENGTLSSSYPVAKEALEMNAMCSYWISTRERVKKQFVVWKEAVHSNQVSENNAPTDAGTILPPVITMGTITRRSVEKTWLTASNAKKNRIGSELKSMIRAPPGYAIVGADVDSEELWICSVLGDSQFGIHGATALGWMTLEGTKAEGTDLHSKTAEILGITRDGAKVFNYSRLYGAGVKHAVLLLTKGNPSLSQEQAKQMARDLYRSTKGLRNRAGSLSWDKTFWHGGTESYVFNMLEQIATSEAPQTPTLGCHITQALSPAHLRRRMAGSEDYMPSKVNWVVQSSGVDYLHMLIVGMEYLIEKYVIQARYMISVHDEIRYLVKEEDKYRASLALQIANLWTRSMFAYSLQMEDLPQSCAFFSAVDVDKYLRKEVNMTCQTPSQTTPLPPGESLDIYRTIEQTNGSLSSSMEDGAETSSDELEEFLKNLGSEDKWRPSQRKYREPSVSFLTAQATSSKRELKRLGDATRLRSEKAVLQEQMRNLHGSQNV
ncbi:hypothetical protein BT69DRAFT_1248512 [Atractiella rhizophila]|nr:hypothetical protein BT69DRAFT_1248512 [Atractiella rhizophila]